MVMAGIIVISLAGSAWSAVVYDQWIGAPDKSDWNTSENWATGYVPNILAPNEIDNVRAGLKTATGPVLGAETTNAAAYQITIGGTPGGILTMSGGSLYVSQYIAMGASVADNGTLDMNSCTVTIGQKLFVGQMGTGTVNMRGGNINITAELSIADLNTATGTVNLNGGVITASLLQMKRSGGGTAKLDIGGGTLILDGDQSTAITNFGSMITAYNGLGTLHVDYNNINAGKTTVMATIVQPQAGNPGPSNGAANVVLNAALSWTAGDGAVSHNVYFGTVSPGASQGNQSGTTFNPGALTPSTTYFWRIDEVNESNGVTTGNVWNFITTTGQALSPSPANSATSVSLNPTLSWTAGSGAESHNVYFGTASPGVSQGNQSVTTFNPGTLAAKTTYYWRIDEVIGSNIITGNVWSFATSNSAPVNPYLSWRNDPTNSIVINWWNPFAAGDSNVEYGLTSDYGSNVNISAATNFHHVELTGLLPSTTYHYRVNSNDGTSTTEKTFTSADAIADANAYSFSFALYGDPRGTQSAKEPYYTRHRALCDWIAAGGYKFALETGDTVWAGGITALNPLTAQGYFQDFYNLERNLAGSKVIMATMGSHEVQAPDAGGTVTYAYYYDLYKDTFPTNGSSIDTNKCRVYSFNYGNAHFVSLSSFQIDVNLQKDWLIADLIAARANPNIKWIFVMMHAPLYTTNGHTVAQSMIDAWAPVFEQYGVDMVFSSHNHCYERSFPIRSGQVAADGHAPIYLTNGMGGAEFNATLASPLFAARYGSEAGGSTTTVVTTVTINGLLMTVDTIKNATGEPVDSFTLMKTLPSIAGDFNGDHKVDITDLGIFCGSWLDSGMWP